MLDDPEFYVLTKTASFRVGRKPTARTSGRHMLAQPLNKLPQTQQNYDHILRQLETLPPKSSLVDFPGWAVNRRMDEMLGRSVDALPTDVQHVRRRVSPYAIGAGAGAGGYGLYELGRAFAGQNQE